MAMSASRMIADGRRQEFALFEPGCRHVAKDIEGKGAFHSIYLYPLRH